MQADSLLSELHKEFYLEKFHVFESYNRLENILEEREKLFLGGWDLRKKYFLERDSYLVQRTFGVL